MKRKKLILIILSLVVVLAVIGITLAYFTANKSVDNAITIGKNEVEVSEDFVPPIEQTTDTKYKKQISVTNTGNVDCYVRVYADFSDEAIRKKSYFSNDTDINNELSYYSAVRDMTDDNAYVKHLLNDWVFVPDDSSETKLAGYYYYKNPIKPNESTPSLFTFVRTEYDNANDVKQYDIIVYSESVQTTDSNGKEYAGYKAAWNDFLK